MRVCQRESCTLEKRVSACLRWFVQGIDTDGVDALQCIVEEGFQATFSGSSNGDVYGAGIYFATSAALADNYTETKTSNVQCKMFLARIAPGDPCGALRMFAHE